MKLTTLTKPSTGAVLLLYLVALPTAVCVGLVEEKECENKMKSFPIYFVLEAPLGAKLNYSELKR